MRSKNCLLYTSAAPDESQHAVHPGLRAVEVSRKQHRADIAEPVSYTHLRNFASKEDVLQQESVRLTNEWKTNFDQEHPDGTPGQDNLWLVSLLDFYKDHAEFYLALYLSLIHI